MPRRGFLPVREQVTILAVVDLLMRILRAAFVLLSLSSLAAPPKAQAGYEPGQLFAAVTEAIATSYYDRAFREGQWPDLVARYAHAAQTASTVDEERAVIDGLLQHVPASHLALYSKATYDQLLRELSRRDAPTFGFELEQRAGRFFVIGLLEGGPAMRAGVRRGDRVLAIDGVLPGASARLDRSSDDAHLPDPPRHLILGAADDRIELDLQRRADAAPITVAVTCASYSAWRATQASVDVREHAGRRIGYVHYWFVHLGGIHHHFARLLREDFATCDACILDLRGRGGDGMAAGPLVETVRKAGKPVIALIDAGSRSAKEVIAYRLQQEQVATLVGEHTARAVIPASFRRVGKADVLMFPTFTLGKFTEAIEGIGIEPDVLQADALPYAAGDDPILRAGLREAARQAGR